MAQIKEEEILEISWQITAPLPLPIYILFYTCSSNLYTDTFLQQLQRIFTMKVDVPLA